MSALAHYREGRLSEAIAAATADVKARPTDLPMRVFLCELLGFAGDWTRVDRQLDAMSQLAPETAVNVGVWRQLVKAAQARDEFYTQGRLPKFLTPPGEELQLRLKASIAVREGDGPGAEELFVQAEQVRPTLSGVCNDKPFGDCRDLDDQTASLFEVLTTTGDYYWVPMEAVERVAFHPPAGAARDLLWRSAELSVRSGPVGGVFIPVTYHASANEQDDVFRLGRATDWREEPGAPPRGVGQRMFQFGGDELSILELAEVTFAAVQ